MNALTKTTLGIIAKTTVHRLSRGGWWQLMSAAWQGDEVLACLTSDEMDVLVEAMDSEDGTALRQLVAKVQPELRDATLAGLERFAA